MFSASQVHSADETGVSCVHKQSKICAQQGQKTVWTLTSAEKERTNTILACGSASGHVIPPMIIFPRERISLELMAGAPPDTLFTGTKLVWVNNHFSSGLNFLLVKFLPIDRYCYFMHPTLALRS